MDKQDIRTILDSLDVQVSMGRIDQATYDMLKNKWMQQLQAIETRESTSMVDIMEATSTPVAKGNTGPLVPVLADVLPLVPPTPPIEEPHYTIEVLACPKCMGAAELQVGQDLTQPIQCPFCDTVYTLRQSRDNDQQLKKELKAWLDQVLVGSGYAATSNVDVNARRFIFSESLYPALKKDVDRRLEAFENVLEAPLVQMQETKDFRDYRPNVRLIAMAQGDNQWLKTLSTRVSAQQLQDFAVVHDDKQRLQQLRLRVLSLLHYANIAHHQLAPTIASYQLVRQNVIALQKDYQEYVREIADEHHRSYIQALDARVSGDILLLDVFIAALGEEHPIVPETLLLQVNNAIIQLDKAYQLAQVCTYNPLYTMPLQQGIQKDTTIARIFQSVATSFEVVTRTHREEFKPFYERLMRYVQSLAPMQSAEHLLWLLTSVGRVLLARTGDAPLPVVKDWSWLAGAIEGQRRRSAFGMSGEADQVLTRHYHPYWVARLSYSEVGGRLVKKATVREGFMLVDATMVNAPIVAPVMETDAAQSLIQVGLQSFQLLDTQVVSMPAALTHDMAERAMKAYAHTHEVDLKVLAIRMIGVLYLPVAFIRYTVKDRQRDSIVSCVSGVNQDLIDAFKRTQEFLQSSI